jgi:hypothetical protein
MTGKQATRDAIFKELKKLRYPQAGKKNIQNQFFLLKQMSMNTTTQSMNPRTAK